MRYVIIGGGVAGITAARTIREHDLEGEITVFTDEFHPLGLYARKDMARRLATGIGAPEDFLLEGQDALAEQGITLMYREALRVFTKQRQVLIKHHIRRAYDRLLVAVGASPRLVDVPGLHLIGVHQLRNYEDISLIEAWMPELRETGAIIVGGGILGLDVAWALKERGVPTTLVAREGHLGLPLLPERAGRLLEARLGADGVTLILERTVDAYVSADFKVLDGVRLSDDRFLPGRMALCAVGVWPPTAFLDESGIVVDEETGAIPVDAHLQTNLEGIYAAGQCALVDGRTARNWSLSAEQGRVAGLNMVGERVSYAPEVPGDLHTRIYDLPLAYFGCDTVSVKGEEVWTWDDGQAQFAQVCQEVGRITGATLLGEVAALGPELHERCKAGTPTTPADLTALAARAR